MKNLAPFYGEHKNKSSNRVHDTYKFSTETIPHCPIIATRELIRYRKNKNDHDFHHFKENGRSLKK